MKKGRIGELELSSVVILGCQDGRHSSVVLSPPTIMRLWVQIPIIHSKLFSICIIEIEIRKGRK